MKKQILVVIAGLVLGLSSFAGNKFQSSCTSGGGCSSSSSSSSSTSSSSSYSSGTTTKCCGNTNNLFPADPACQPMMVNGELQCRMNGDWKTQCIGLPQVTPAASGSGKVCCVAPPSAGATCTGRGIIQNRYQ